MWIVDSTLLYGENDIKDLYIWNIVLKRPGKSFRESFNFDDTFSGDVEYPVIRSMYEVATIGSYTEFFHFFADGSLND